MAFPGVSNSVAEFKGLKRTFVRFEGALPLHGEDLTLPNLRLLNINVREEEGCPVVFTLTVDKDQRARLREMHAFVAAANFATPASRSDYGAVENFTFKWKRADRSD